MSDTTTLPASVSNDRSTVNIVLFSRPNCPFCKLVRENYLQPMQVRRPPGLHLAEVSIEGRSTMRDFDGRPVLQSGFAEHMQARFSPTVVFLDPRGREVAERIVGLSNDFFGAYLDARIEQARQAVR